MFEPNSLNESLVAVGAKTDGTAHRGLFEKLSAMYGEPGRHYHSQSHVTHCLAHLQTWRHLARNPAEIEVAIWFHDAIYDTRRSDNEERSAEWAREYLQRHHVQDTVVARIFEMIMATKHHQVEGGDIALLVDIDLGILGASAANFEVYDRQIREEYHWVPSVAYRLNRRTVLKQFLDREVIYRTHEIYNQLELRARNNLQRRLRIR